NSSCGLLVPPKAVLAGFLGFSEQFLWTSWTTSWLSGEDFS
ncbi:7554_t:CDS:2, partial [Rhizophagus irregularis]